MNNLHDVLVDLTKDMYHAEKQLIKALPKMAKATSSRELRKAIEDHLAETEGHVERLEEAFALLEMKPTAKPCHGMIGLIEEGAEVIKEKSEGEPAAIDAALIAAAQKVEHYEICAYGTLATFAEQLGLDDLAEVFKATLSEEETADERLNEIAEGSVNAQAAEENGEEEDAGAARGKKARNSRKRTGASSNTRASGGRERIAPRGDTRFIRRDGRGRITESDDAGKSLRADRRKKAQSRVKSGHGDRGDRR
jgi:ferritin-like metal-binding protein YciE